MIGCKKESGQTTGLTNLGLAITLPSIPLWEGDYYEEKGWDGLQSA